VRYGLRTRTGLLGAFNFNVTNAIDINAGNFINAAGITNPTQIDAINRLVIDLKDASIWTKMLAVYPFVGGTAATHKWNLKDPRDLDAAFRLAFTGGWTHASTGATPNGTTGYADTFFIPNLKMVARDTHLSCYSRSDSGTATIKVEIGSATNLNELPIISLQAKRAGNVALSDAYDYNVNRISASNTNSQGFYVGSRTAINVHKLYKNGTQIGSTNTTNENQNALPSHKIYIGAYNSNGNAGGFSDRELAFASMGSSLTDGEVSTFNSIVTTYQTALGRNV